MGIYIYIYPKRANGRRHPAKCTPLHKQSEQTAADIQQGAPLYTTKASKRPQTSSKVHPSTSPQRANGRRHPSKCTPLHQQSEPTAADIQQSAPFYTSKASQRPQTSSEVHTNPMLQLLQLLCSIDQFNNAAAY